MFLQSKDTHYQLQCITDCRSVTLWTASNLKTKVRTDTLLISWLQQLGANSSLTMFRENGPRTAQVSNFISIVMIVFWPQDGVRAAPHHSVSVSELHSKHSSYLSRKVIDCIVNTWVGFTPSHKLYNLLPHLARLNFRHQYISLKTTRTNFYSMHVVPYVQSCCVCSLLLGDDRYLLNLLYSMCLWAPLSSQPPVWVQASASQQINLSP